MVLPSAKVVNLQLQASGILLVRDVAPALRLALASMRGVHTNLTVPPPFKVEELVLVLGSDRFLSFLP